MQVISTSALGSVYGKKLGRNRILAVLTEQLAQEHEQRALQIRQRDVLADDEPFDLREHRRVGEVEVVAAIHAPRRDQPHRRLMRSM